MKVKLLTVVIFIGMLIARCANNGREKETLGTVLGAAGSGLLGAQFGKRKGQLAAAAAGIFWRSSGQQYGRIMDEVDRMKACQALEQATYTPI